MGAEATVMVIEDDADTSDVLAALLEAHGDGALVAAGGREGQGELVSALRSPCVADAACHRSAFLLLQPVSPFMPISSRLLRPSESIP